MYCEIMENYVAGNHGKMYLADGEPMKIVGVHMENLQGETCTKTDS